MNKNTSLVSPDWLEQNFGNVVKLTGIQLE